MVVKKKKKVFLSHIKIKFFGYLTKHTRRLSDRTKFNSLSHTHWEKKTLITTTICKFEIKSNRVSFFYNSNIDIQGK